MSHSSRPPTDREPTIGHLAPLAPLEPSWIGVSMGDPNGIGPEVILKAHLAEPHTLHNAMVFAYKEVLSRAMDVLGAHSQLQLVPMQLQRDPEGRQAWSFVQSAHFKRDPELQPVYHLDMGGLSQEAREVFLSTRKKLSDLDQTSLSAMGQVDAQSGEMAARAIVLGARVALQGLTRALVTAPIHKGSLALAGWPYPGHTELLQAECARFLGKSLNEMPVRMMLKNHELAVVLVSIHISLRQAIECVSFDNVLQTVVITHEALQRSWGRSPKIAVSALNPHAGEGGLMGEEEQTILGPVVLKAQAMGLDVSGPFSPDTVYMRARHMQVSKRAGEVLSSEPEPFDVVIAMYHDQGLIPVKYMGLDEGVNITLGLPIVRTSPDHGTAFDIAGTGRCDERSFLEAFRQAQKMAGA